MVKGYFIASLLICGTIISNCKYRDSALSGAGAKQERIDWISKSSRTLRGVGIGPNDDIEILVSKSDDEVLEYLMNDPLFGHVLVHFGQKFYNRARPIPTRDIQEWLLAIPQASAAARALLDGEDFFALFSRSPTFLATDVRLPQNLAPLAENPSAEEKSQHDKLVREARDLTWRSTKILIDGALRSNEDGRAICRRVGAFINERDGLFLERAGFGRLGLALGQSWGREISQECIENPNVEKIKLKLKDVLSGVERLYKMVESFTAERTTQDLRQAIKLNLELTNLTPILSPFSQIEFWNKQTNSSTNANRARGAYLLKTMFCDDMLPLNIQHDKNSHVKGLHASNRECRGCHYKLDPIAGLFRYYGAEGDYVRGGSRIFFDDGKVIEGAEFARYLDENWSDAPGKKPNVGYFVKAGVPHPEWRGDDLNDIWAFAPRSQEVRQCLTKRLTQFFLGPNQAVDPNWIASISTDVKPGPQSGVTVKKFIKTLLTSNTYKAANPQPGQCYDEVVATNNQPESGQDLKDVPCVVRSLITEKCLSCHNAASESKLQLDHWSQNGSNQSWFKHHGENNQLLTVSESKQKIQERLNTDVEAKRMPPSGEMNDVERQSLFLWLQQ